MTKRKLSDLRAKLLKNQQLLQQLMDTFNARSAMLPGSLYQLNRKCGKENCRCTKGQLHSSTVLAYRGQEKTQTITPDQEHLNHIKQMTDDYRRFRKRRAELVKLQKETLAIVEKIQQLRVQEGEREFQNMRSA